MYLQLLMKKFLILATALLAFACTKADDPNGDNGGNGKNSCSLSGFAQKGQLAKGSQVTAFAIGKDLVATGESFPANISDDRGAFAINGQSTAPYLDLRADGYYFDEVNGGLSSNPLYLEAFVESSDKNANLNLMTTAIKLRVKKLIKDGSTYAEANKKAQSELLEAFGVSVATADFSEMDITKGTDSDAILLAAACLAQYGRSASEITTLAQEIASDLESDGKISSTNVDKLTVNKKKIDVFNVIENLAAYYNDKGITDASLPAFYQYLNDDLKKDFVIYDDVMSNSTAIIGDISGNNWGEINGGIRILSTKEFEVSSDAAWMTATKANVLGPAYRITYKGEENSTAESRIAHITFKDKSGNVLATKEFSQSAKVSTLYLAFDSGTKGSLSTDIPQVGDKVLVNEDLVEVKSVEGNYAIVDVKPSTMYRVSWPAENMGYNEKVSYVVKTFPAEVSSDVKAQYYGALQQMDGSEMSGTFRVTMSNCTAVLRLAISGFPTASYITITGGNTDDFISGTCTYVWMLSDLAFDPTLVEFLSKENVSNKVKVTGLNGDGTIYVQMLPQQLPNGFSVGIYDASGTELVSKTTSKSITFQRGNIVSMGTISNN